MTLGEIVKQGRMVVRESVPETLPLGGTISPLWFSGGPGRTELPLCTTWLLQTFVGWPSYLSHSASIIHSPRFYLPKQVIERNFFS